MSAGVLFEQLNKGIRAGNVAETLQVLAQISALKDFDKDEVAMYVQSTPSASGDVQFKKMMSQNPRVWSLFEQIMNNVISDDDTKNGLRAAAGRTEPGQQVAPQVQAMPVARGAPVPVQASATPAAPAEPAPRKSRIPSFPPAGSPPPRAVAQRLGTPGGHLRRAHDMAYDPKRAAQLGPQRVNELAGIFGVSPAAPTPAAPAPATALMVQPIMSDRTPQARIQGMQIDCGSQDSSQVAARLKASGIVQPTYLLSVKGNLITVTKTPLTAGSAKLSPMTPAEFNAISAIVNPPQPGQTPRRPSGPR